MINNFLKFFMKYLVSFSMLLKVCLSYSQEMPGDSLIRLVENKAKLLTITNFGICHPAAIIENALAQKIEIIPEDEVMASMKMCKKQFIFMKITFSQKFLVCDSINVIDRLLLNKCEYIIAYNFKLVKFYRLNGFIGSDFVEFYEDLQKTSCFSYYPEDIHFECLYKYYFKNKKCPFVKSCDQTGSEYIMSR